LAFGMCSFCCLGQGFNIDAVRNTFINLWTLNTIGD
jgi:hypothetical protein